MGSPAWTYLSTSEGYMLFLWGEAQGGMRVPPTRTHTSCGIRQKACRTGSVGLRMSRETAEAECERLNAAYCAYGREEASG